MGSGRNFATGDPIFSRDTQTQRWREAAEGIWQSTGAAQTDGVVGKHFVGCLCRVSATTFSGTRSSTAGCKT